MDWVSDEYAINYLTAIKPRGLMCSTNLYMQFRAKNIINLVIIITQ